MEVRINKEVKDYQESIFFGLSLRQFVFSILAVGVAVAVYFLLKDIVGTSEVGWMCILAALPFALCGFFKYNGMPAEKFLAAFLRSEYLTPKKLMFKADNLYAKAMSDSSVKEVLIHD